MKSRNLESKYKRNPSDSSSFKHHPIRIKDPINSYSPPPRQYENNAAKTTDEQIKKDHPEEYHYSFKEIRNFLKNAGFHNLNIIPSPSYFAIVSAEKYIA